MSTIDPSAQGFPDEWCREVHQLANGVIRVAHRREATPLVDQILDAGANLPVRATLSVVGHRSRGKSALINALLAATVTPEDVDVATNVYISISHGEAPGATVLFRGEREPQPIDPAELRSYATVQGEHRHDVAYVDVRWPAPLLTSGLTLYDTPGLGGLDEAHNDVALETMQETDGTLIVVDPRKPPSDVELAFVQRAVEHSPLVLVAANCRPGLVGDPRQHLDALTEIVADPERVLTVNALGEDVRAYAEAHPEEAELLLRDTGLDALARSLEAFARSVRRSRYRLLLERTSAAVDELGRADRELLQIEGSGEDPAERARELREELEQLVRLQPANELTLRLTSIRQEVAADFTAELARGFRELRDEATTAWTDALRDEMPDRCERHVTQTWAQANRELGEQAGEAFRAVCAQMQVLDVAIPGVGDDVALPEGHVAPRKVVEPAGLSTAERGIRVGRNLLTSGALINFGAPILLGAAAAPLLPLMIPLGIAISVKEDQAMRARNARQATIAFIAESQSAAAGLQAQLASRGQQLYEGLTRDVQQRFLARRDALDGAVRQLADVNAHLVGAKERMAELEPLEAALRQVADADPDGTAVEA